MHGDAAMPDTEAVGAALAGMRVDESLMESRLAMVQSLVAQPVPEADNHPGLVGDGMYVGNKNHAANVDMLLSLGVRAVLNCAPSGIRGLPIGAYQSHRIEYSFTNVAQDDFSYPILHRPDGTRSGHLDKACAFYDRARRAGGTMLFFCVAGQNRSATLAVAVQLVKLRIPLQQVLGVCASSRPFILENAGFQRQLIELEAKVASSPRSPLDVGESPSASFKKRQRLNRPTSLAPTGELDEGPRSSPFIDSEAEWETVQVELLVPGLQALNVEIGAECTIDEAREELVNAVDLCLSEAENDAERTPGRAERQRGARVGNAWLIVSTFGGAEGFNLVLDEAAVERHIQLERLASTFGCELSHDVHSSECQVRWRPSCRFELVIFSLRVLCTDSRNEQHLPFTFRHQERAGARGTLLEESNLEPHLRAWDFTSGLPYRSAKPIVFSFSHDERSRRDFMAISEASGERQHFSAPGEGSILGMGNNAIVHRVRLDAVEQARDGSPSFKRRRAADPKGAEGTSMSTSNSPTNSRRQPRVAAGFGEVKPTEPPKAVEAAPAEGGTSGPSPRKMQWPSMARIFSTASMSSLNSLEPDYWDAAVKRQFSMAKMLASLNQKSEAGVAKRLRMAGALNQQGRLLFFHGLGVCLASNNEDQDEYKFEATLISQYLEDFSSYTLKRFMDDFVLGERQRAALSHDERQRVEVLQHEFSLIKVKVLLVSLLNGFRDLTLMGVQAFDFNHLSNVLISRDYRKARLIDIDGNSKGSIQAVSAGGKYIGLDDGDGGDDESSAQHLHKPALEVDLSILLPMVVQQLIFGKGRGKAFVEMQVSKVWRSRTEEEAKATIRTIVRENFFAGLPEAPADEVEAPADSAARKHLEKVRTTHPCMARKRPTFLSTWQVVEWSHALLRKRPPWSTWTNDIYDAMRCIDHLPIG